MMIFGRPKRPTFRGAMARLGSRLPTVSRRRAAEGELADQPVRASLRSARPRWQVGDPFASARLRSPTASNIAVS